MTKKYTVKITDEALGDMRALYEYIAIKLQAPQNAMGQYKRIADKILTLDTFPERYGLVDFEPEHSLGLHRMIVDNYHVFYIVDSDCVTVTNVLYGASDIKSRLRDK